MNKLLTKIASGLLGLSLAVGVGVAVGGVKKAEKVSAVDVEVTADSFDATGKLYGTSNYNVSTVYGDWTVVNGANNNKSWAYFKMGGKSATLSDYNPCYIYRTAASTEIYNKIKVHIPAGSLSKSGMGVTSWGLFVYSDSAMQTQVDSVSGGTITANEGTFTFEPSAGKTWAKGYYYKVSWTLTNTTTTNGIVCVDKITCYKEGGTNYNLSASSGLTLSENTITSSGGDITLTTAARKKGTNLTVTGTHTKTVSDNVISFTSVGSDLSISATIVDAVPTLSVTGQKTRFKLDESWSFGGTVKATYDDWVSPHTCDTLASGYILDNSDFQEGVEGTYTIVVSFSGAQNFEYNVTVSPIEEKADLINVSAMEATGTSYTTYTFNGSSSQTAYNSQNAVDSTTYLQYRSNNSNSGIVNTNTKGIAKSVTITAANKNTATFNVYGSNTSYTDPTDLYNGEKQGTLVDSTSSTKTITFNDDYTYVGIRSNSGAGYLESIEIIWLVAPKAVHHISASNVTEPGPFYVGTKPTLNDLGVTVEAYYDQAETDHEDVTSLATISYPASGLTDDNNGGDGYTISFGGKTTTVNITAEVADVYAKLSSVSDLIVGSTVRIATDSAVMTATADGVRLSSISGNPNDASLADVANMTVGADKDGYYFSITDNGTKYLTCSSDSATLSFGATLDSTSHWNITINNSGVARIYNASYPSREVRKNTNNNYFSSYNGGETAVSIFQLVDNDMTEPQKIAAQIDTFGKLYLHKIDILDNATTRLSDGNTCNSYYDKAKAALSGEWSSIQENFSKDESGMWERYCSWAWVTYKEIPSFSNGEISYDNAKVSLLSKNEVNNKTIALIVIISMTSVGAIAGYFFIRKRRFN